MLPKPYTGIAWPPSRDMPEHSSVSVLCMTRVMGVPEDDAEAVRWYQMVAERGNAEVQFNLGNMYRQGEGVLAGRWC